MDTRNLARRHHMHDYYEDVTVSYSRCERVSLTADGKTRMAEA